MEATTLHQGAPLKSLSNLAELSCCVMLCAISLLLALIVAASLNSTAAFFAGAAPQHRHRSASRALQQREQQPRYTGMTGVGNGGPVIPPGAPGLKVIGEETLGDVPGSDTPSLWNVPNILTLARLASIPVFGAVFYLPLSSCRNRNLWCAGIFAGAAVTDWLDGWWARKFNIASPFGAFLDPVADKLMVAVAMILLSERLGVWMTVCSSIILCREIAVSALREWMAQIGARGVVKVGMAGKCKTAAQMVALSLLLLQQPGASRALRLPELFSVVGKYLMVFSTVLTVTSGYGYLVAAWPALMGKAHKSS